MPTARDHRADLLTLAGEVRRDGEWRRGEDEITGGREPEARARGGQLTLDNRPLKDVLSKKRVAPAGLRGVPDERAAGLQADGIGTIDASLSGAKSGAGWRHGARNAVCGWSSFSPASAYVESFNGRLRDKCLNAIGIATANRGTSALHTCALATTSGPGVNVFIAYLRRSIIRRAGAQ
jgi:hypothetical protein